MAETEGKKSKIVELLDFIETRLGELEEEKEELKEFQEKNKEKRCLEYALYQRELEEVAEALEEIEEERKKELHGANQRRELFSDREQQIQVSALIRPYFCTLKPLMTFRHWKNTFPRRNMNSPPFS
jgi:structural maintenance of chromosome 3 (chondroitin sulfate proteoglycan 6)